MRIEEKMPPCGWCGGSEWGKGLVVLEIPKANAITGVEGLRTHADAFVCIGCGNTHVFVRHPDALVRGGWFTRATAPSSAPPYR